MVAQASLASIFCGMCCGQFTLALYPEVRVRLLLLDWVVDAKVRAFAELAAPRLREALHDRPSGSRTRRKR